MQRKPFLRLFDTVVMEFVVHPTRSQRFQQIAPHCIGKLTGVNNDVGSGRHAMFVAETAPQNKYSP
jgi:hypothetical protein